MILALPRTRDHVPFQKSFTFRLTRNSALFIFAQKKIRQDAHLPHLLEKARTLVMSPLDLVRLTALMDRTRGRVQVLVGLIDGPVAIDHADLARENIREVPGKTRGHCARAESIACMHGTFVAGILCGKRKSAAPAICPDCTLLVRPIFIESVQGKDHMPSATPGELAMAIRESIDAGARVINLSAALAQPSSRGE